MKQTIDLALAAIYTILLFSTQANAFDKSLRIGSGGRTIHDFRRQQEIQGRGREGQGHDSASVESTYTAATFRAPIDHFHSDPRYLPHESGYFENRYWFDGSHYSPGGPVIVLLGGETSGEDRIPFLKHGILAQLAAATHGVGVVLEHRYYGESFPTPDLSRENLRFLTTEQAMADTAFFARNVRFPGLEWVGDLTSGSVPWIVYGGSYAGAMAAFMRVEYPDLFWGGIGSSAVTKGKSAVYEYSEYFAPLAEYGPRLCITAQQLFVDMVDNIILGKDDDELTAKLQTAFGLPNVTHVQDFANQLSSGVGLFQSLNWDPAVSNPGFTYFCNNITSHKLLYPTLEDRRGAAEKLLAEGGYPKANSTIVTQLLNYIGWIETNVVAPCAAEGNTQDYCFGSHNSTFYRQDGHDQQGWRSWAYQYCDQWGYLQTGSGVPADQMPLISRAIDVRHSSIVCREAFGMSRESEVERTNRYGGYNLSYARLAFIDGEWDPWRPVTPHGFGYGAAERKATMDEPFILIEKALHHYDQNGLKSDEEGESNLPPRAVAEAQTAERDFVRVWVDDWQRSRGGLVVQKG